jgi:hypothetical protein
MQRASRVATPSRFSTSASAITPLSDDNVPPSKRAITALPVNRLRAGPLRHALEFFAEHGVHRRNPAPIGIDSDLQSGIWEAPLCSCKADNKAAKCRSFHNENFSEHGLCG